MVKRQELAAAIAEVEPMLKPDVVRLRYTIKEDWSGEPAIYFRVLLTDDASNQKRLHEVTTRVEELIETRIDPLNSWDLLPYFNYRSESEQEDMKAPAWA